MTTSLTDRLQHRRMVVVSIDREQGRLRVKGESCTDLWCHVRTIVVTEDGSQAAIDALFPGDVVRIEEMTEDDLPVMKIVVLRRVWEAIASPEN